MGIVVTVYGRYSNHVLTQYLREDYPVPTLTVRCDNTVMTLLEQLQYAGFGKTKTDIVLAALDLLSESSLIDLAKARMAKLERAAELGKEVVTVVAKPVEPAAVPEPDPACEVCGEPLAIGNSRYCVAHIPPMEE